MWFFFSPRQCKATFCTTYKCMVEDEEGTGAGLACLHSWSVPNRERIENTEMRNVRATALYNFIYWNVCRKNLTKEKKKPLHCLVSFNARALFKCCEREWQHYKMVKAIRSQHLLCLESVTGLKCKKKKKRCILTEEMRLTLLHTVCKQKSKQM